MLNRVSKRGHRALVIPAQLCVILWEIQLDPYLVMDRCQHAIRYDCDGTYTNSYWKQVN